MKRKIEHNFARNYSARPKRSFMKNEPQQKSSRMSLLDAAQWMEEWMGQWRAGGKIRRALEETFESTGLNGQ